MRPIIIERAILAADADAIALSQTPGAAGDLIINGILAQTIYDGYPTAPRVRAVIGQQQQVSIFAVGNEAGKTFTIYGENDLGIKIHETITGPGVGLTVISVLSYAIVDRVTISAAAAAAVTVGIANQGDTDPIPLDQYVPNSRTTISLEFTGTAQVDVEFTNDNPFNKEEVYGEQGYTPPPVAEQGLLWFPHPVAALTNAVANDYGSTEVLMKAVRLRTNSGTGEVRMTINQQSAL